DATFASANTRPGTRTPSQPGAWSKRIRYGYPAPVSPRPSASKEQTTIAAASPTRNRRVKEGAARPAAASTSISPPGKNTLSFFECTSARIVEVASPQTRFSLEAANHAAGPAE